MYAGSLKKFKSINIHGSSMIRFLLTVLLIHSCIVGRAQSNKPAKQAILFSIRGTQISANEFEYLYKKNHQSKDDFAAEKIDEYLKLFINFKLKVAEARQRGIDTTAAFVKEYNSYKEELKKPYLPESKIVDSLVKITYGRLQEEVRVSHILIEVKADATSLDTLQAYTKAFEIKNKALAGEDFGSLAALYSEEPMARTSKGDLGYFTALQMVFPFENAAYSSAKGEITNPVRTRFGYHILKIEDRKPSRGEVEVSHIMIRVGGERNADKAKNLVFEIYDRLRGGMKWEDLCNQYSEDPGSKSNGGKLKPFGVGVMAALPEFDRAAFSLKNTGDLSDPFQTRYGWHIMRLERKIPLPPFSELAPNLKSRVARDERVQISKQALLKRLKNSFSFQEMTSVKSKIFALADTLLVKGKWKPPANFAASKEVLFSIKSKSTNAQNFMDYIQRNQKATSQPPEKIVEQLYNSFVEKKISEAQEIDIIMSNPDFVMLLNEYYEGILLFDIMEKEVWKKANEDSVGQVRYFEQNSKKYLAGERAVTALYSSNSQEHLEKLNSYIQQHDTLSIAKAVQTKNVRVEQGLFQREDRPVLAKISWKPGLYPVESGGMYYLAYITEVLPPGPMTFEESRANVISDYQDHLERQWLEQLRKKYPVKVNEKVKKNVFAKIRI